MFMGYDKEGLIRDYIVLKVMLVIYFHFKDFDISCYNYLIGKTEIQIYLKNRKIQQNLFTYFSM